jgi:hypothetical protein
MMWQSVTSELHGACDSATARFHITGPGRIKEMQELWGNARQIAVIGRDTNVESTSIPAVIVP